MRSATLRMAVAAIGAAMVLGASATAASAAVATFSTTGSLSMTQTSPLVIKIGTTPTPATTVTCSGQPASLTGNAINVAAGQGAVNQFEMNAVQCVSLTGQQSQVLPAQNNRLMLATKSGSVFSLSGTDAWYLQIVMGVNLYVSSPAYAPVSYTASWLNGTTGPSKLVFNNAPIGRVAPGYALAGQPITLSATFSVTQGGNPITLS